MAIVGKWRLQEPSAGETLHPRHGIDLPTWKGLPIEWYAVCSLHVPEMEGW